MLSMAQAAAETGVSKSTILRAIRAGRLSATRLDDGRFEIDPAELMRVYAPTPRGAPLQMEHHASPTDALVTQLREQLAELRADRDAWREQAQRLVLAPPPPRKRWSLFGRS